MTDDFPTILVVAVHTNYKSHGSLPESTSTREKQPFSDQSTRKENAANLHLFKTI